MFKTRRTPFLKENWNELLKTTYLTIFVNNSCNKSCKYCIMNNDFFVKNFGESYEMSLKTFVKLLKIFRQYNINFLRIVGKEPLLWKNIDKGTYIAKNLGFDITIITNGTILKENFYINNLNIHIDLSYLGDNIKYLDFWRNLSKRRDFKIAFMIVITGNEAEIDLLKYKDLSLKYADYVSLFLKTPVLFKEEDKKAANKLIGLYRLLYETGFKNISIEHPIPYCLINKNNFVFLDKNNIKFGGTCHSGKDFIINFDGRIVFPCIGLLNYYKNLNFNKVDILHIGRDYFFDYLDKLRNNMPKEECYTCKWYKDKLCQGGCLVNRYYLKS